MKLLKHSIIFLVIGILSGFIMQNSYGQEIDFTFKKVCQNEVIINNLSDAHAYLWKVKIDGSTDSYFTTSVNKPVFNFIGIAQGQLVEIELTAYDENYNEIGAVTKALELTYKPSILIRKTNTVVCSNEKNVTFTADIINGYAYEWEIIPPAGDNLDDIIANQYLPTNNELISDWKSVETVKEVLILLTVTSEMNNEMESCTFKYSNSVLIIPNKIPGDDDKPISIVRKASGSNLILCLNSNQESVIFDWGLNDHLVKSDTLPYHEYNDIELSSKYWLIIKDRTFSSCTTDTLFCDLTKSFEFDNETMQKAHPAISIFPNPASMILNINFEKTDGEQVQIKIKDQFGRMIWACEKNMPKHGDNIVIYPPEHIKGMCFIEFCIDNQFRTVKKIIFR